jgi:CheY-like chemotaxis protein
MAKEAAKKVMLVEDDPTQSMMYELEFKNNGYHVIIADNGAKALKTAVLEQPDIIFLDMILGDMSGLELLKRLKAEPKTKNIKTVVLSNLQKKEIIDEAKAVGALDFLVKMHFFPKDVVARCNKYLNS